MSEQQTANYETAQARVAADMGLVELADIILDPNWRESDHWQWVTTAPREEILSWARAIARDIDADLDADPDA